MEKTRSFDSPSHLVKILVATQTISFMTARLSEIHEQTKEVAKVSDVIKECVEEREKLFVEIFERLRAIAEDLGNYIDGQDVLDRIDEVYTQPAFDLMYDRIKD